MKKRQFYATITLVNLIAISTSSGVVQNAPLPSNAPAIVPNAPLPGSAALAPSAPLPGNTFVPLNAVAAAPNQDSSSTFNIVRKEMSQEFEGLARIFEGDHTKDEGVIPGQSAQEAQRLVATSSAFYSIVCKNLKDGYTQYLQQQGLQSGQAETFYDLLIRLQRALAHTASRISNMMSFKGKKMEDWILLQCVSVISSDLMSQITSTKAREHLRAITEQNTSTGTNQAKVSEIITILQAIAKIPSVTEYLGTINEYQAKYSKWFGSNNSHIFNLKGMREKHNAIAGTAAAGTAEAAE